MSSRAVKFILIAMAIVGGFLTVYARITMSLHWNSRTASFLDKEEIAALPWESLREYPWVAVLRGDDGKLLWAAGFREPGEIDALDEIRCQLNGSTAFSHTAVQGMPVTIEDTEYVLDSVRPWSGLMSEPGGEPHINVAVSLDGGDEWIENQILSSGGWWQIDELNLGWSWESSTNTDVSPGAPEVLNVERRWGVRDGNRIHWFTSFLPGTGVERDDGSVVSLVGLEERSGWDLAIVVEVSFGAESARRNVVPVMTESAAQEEFIFIDPGIARRTVVLTSSRDGEIEYAMYESGKKKSEDAAVWGEIISIADDNILLRIDQVLSKSVVVESGESDFREAVLTGQGRVVRLRQGVTERLGDTSIRYIRGAAPDILAMECLVVGDINPGVSFPFELEEDSSVLTEVESSPYVLAWKNVRIGDGVTLERLYVGLRTFAGWLPAILGLACLIIALRR